MNFRDDVIMNYLRSELKKAVTNKYFIISCISALILVAIHAASQTILYIDYISNIREYQEQINFAAPINTAFTWWIGGSEKNLYASIFFSISPLLASLAYSWSYCHDMKNSYVISTDKKLEYYISKYMATFISSGLTIAMSLLLNFLLILLFVPVLKPDSVYDIYYGIFSNSFLGSAFYTNPFLYIAIFILLNFIFYGLIGCSSLTISIYTKHRIVSVLIPFVMLFAIQYTKSLYTDKIMAEISPMTFLFPAKSAYASWNVIIIEILVLFLITFLGSIAKGLKHD